MSARSVAPLFRIAKIVAIDCVENVAYLLHADRHRETEDEGLIAWNIKQVVTGHRNNYAKRGIIPVQDELNRAAHGGSVRPEVAYATINPTHRRAPASFHELAVMLVSDAFFGFEIAYRRSLDAKGEMVSGDQDFLCRSRTIAAWDKLDADEDEDMDSAQRVASFDEAWNLDLAEVWASGNVLSRLRPFSSAMIEPLIVRESAVAHAFARDAWTRERQASGGPVKVADCEATDEPLRQIVSLNQAAATVNRSAETIRKMKALPDPINEPRPGQPNQYCWDELRPVLEYEYGMKLRVDFPASMIKPPKN